MDQNHPRISAIAAITGPRRVIGDGSTLINDIGKEDLQHFKTITLRHPIILGRKTFDTIKRPLPGRLNIVITRDPNWSFEGVTVAHSLEEALNTAREADSEEVFIIGGGQLYAEALPVVGRLYLTVIDGYSKGDIVFPEYEQDFTKVLSREDHESNGIKYAWITLERGA